MENSNHTYNPRFIHVPDISITPNHSGFTVAYVRNDSHLFFAFSLVNKNDRYQKSVGREMSKNTLENNIATMDDSKSNIDYQSRTGVLRLVDLVHADSITSMLGDHAIIRLTMMDFKHAYLSSMIMNMIIQLKFD